MRECTYRDDRLDAQAKSWHYEGPDWGEIEFAYHRQSDLPYMVERYSFWRDQRGLIERTVFDWDGNILFSGSKPDCDSTRIDTLCGERLTVEIRDYKEGVLRSLERYDTVYGNAMVPHGAFEMYGPDGRIGSRMRYEDGELVASREYDEENPHEDVTTTPLSREEGDRLLACVKDSEYLKACDDSRPLRIRNRTGEVIFERDEQERRYEYHGYDPRLKLHVGFSSRGDWNDVRWYVAHDNGGGEFMESQDDLLAVNGTTGLIAGAVSHFEGEEELSVYRYFPDEEAGGYFAQDFYFTLSDLPGPVWGMHWIGEHSLLLILEKRCIRVDIAPESLTGEDENCY